MSFFGKFRKEGWFLQKQERKLQKKLQEKVELPVIVTEKKLEAFEAIKEGKVIQEEAQNSRETFPKSKAAAFGVRFACGMAVIAAGCVCLNMVNPVLARELPVIGGVFRELQERANIGGVYGDITEYAVPLMDSEQDGKGDSDNSSDGTYTKRSGKTAITISEAYANPKEIYLSLTMESDLPWSEVGYFEYESAKRMELKCSFSVDYVFEGKSKGKDTITDGVLDGILTDDNTFKGVLKIEWESVYRELLEKAEEDHRKDLDLRLKLEQIIGEKRDQEVWQGGYTTAEYLALPKEEREAIQAQRPKEYSEYPNPYKQVWADGPWEFDIPVEIDEREVEIIEVNETNELGVGLKSVTKTPDGVELEVIRNGMNPSKITLLDADGNPQNARTIRGFRWPAETFSIKNTSAVDIYFLDDRFYQEVYRTGIWGTLSYENLSDEEKQEWRELLEEYCIYHKRIEFEKNR